jgi:hypothetical protein
MMQAYAQDCVDHARAVGETSLDYSVASLERVEAILSRAHEQMPRGVLSRLFGRGPSAEEVETLAKAYGGYIGEVIRRAHGGTWEMNSEITPEPAIALRIGDSVIFPPGKVYGRLTNGPEDNIWHYYQVLAREWPGSAV